MWDLRLRCGTQDLLVGACWIFFFFSFYLQHVGSGSLTRD